MNEQEDTNSGNQQPTQTGATHTPQTEAPDNLQHQQVGQNDDLNNMADQNLFQPTQNFPGLLNLTHQTSLSETGSLNEQQQQLSLSLSPSSSSSITQINQNQQPGQKQSLFVTDPNLQFIRGIKQLKYIPIEEAVNRLPLLSEDPKRQVEIKVYTGEQVQYINKMEQDDKFQNMMDNMLNKLQNHSDEDEAMRLRKEILNKLSLEEQQRIKRGFGPQMRLTSFYESQKQRRIKEQNNNAIHIDAGWDFGSGTGEQQDEFQEDFIDEPQQLEIRLLNKKNKKRKKKKQQRSQKKQRNIQAQTKFYYKNQKFGQSPWAIVQLDELSETARESLRPVIHETGIQTTHRSILNVDLMVMITNPFSVPKRIKHQQIAEEAAQVHHAPRETFSTNGNVRKVASSTDSIVSGQIGVAVTKPINIQTAPSTQFQENPIREPKVEKKGGKTPVKGKTTSTNSSVVANWSQREDLQIQLQGASLRTVSTNGNSEQNKRGDSYTRNLSQDPNGGNILIITKRRNVRKNNQFSIDVETKRIGKKKLQERLRISPFSGSREEEIAYTEKLEEELRENVIEQIHPVQAQWFNQTFIIPKLTGNGGKFRMRVY
ncbi:MAG: hypothetical protein EZS28_033419 [Streblomastix strix]|uniref:Uncharacterized protein n=1 Tax=Streblomastix strix TaxID=222440 RepID=A0A5J4UMS0_9EUKA|nr:MAG: hypothetical protein EZS28_033419 [Streblomastix strix]